MAHTEAEFQQTFLDLKKNYEALKKEVETKDHDLNEYKHTLEIVKEREGHYLHEIEILQSQERPEVNKLRTRIKQLQEERGQLNEQINSDMLMHGEKLDRLRDELKTYSKNVFEKTLPAASDEISEENLLLETEVATLKNQLSEKQIHLNHLEEQHSNLLETKNRLHLELEDIKKHLESSKLDIIEAYDLINNLQGTIFTNKTELEVLKGTSIKLNEENSLFAEVNDRRLMFQETLLNLSEKCNKMKLEVSKKQKQILTLRLYKEELTNLLQNDPVECQQDYKTMVDTYISRLSILNHLCEGYEKLLLEKQELLNKGLPNNIVEFLNDMNIKNSKTEEQLNQTISTEVRAQKIMAIQLKEITGDVQKWKATLDQLLQKLVEYEESIVTRSLQSSNALSERKESSTTNTKEKSKDVFANTGNKDTCEEKPKVIEKDKENLSENINISENKPITKQVNFTADTKSSSNHVVRKGRRLVHCKSVHISDLIKEK